MHAQKFVYMLVSIALLCSCRQNENVESQNDLLNSVLWIQHAAEYKAACYQSFNTARAMLIMGLKDEKWTAVIEQKTNYENLPPAIILDIDETVLDNSPYEAAIIRENSGYSYNSWKKWCEERRADAVPGAVDFCQFATKNNVNVIYITNRRLSEYDATRDNLIRVGFPMPIDETVLHMKTDDSDKTTRRQRLVEKYRVILLIGDNGGDFYGEYSKGKLEVRDSLAHKHRPYWGTKWIVLPNPMYGDWDGALFEYNHQWADSKKRKVKTEKLKF